MDLDLTDLIGKVIKETVNFPVLFLPFFVISLLNSILASGALVTAMGANWSLIVNLVAVVLLVPIANAVVIILDRSIVDRRRLSLSRAVNIAFRKAVLLIGVNFIAWMAAISGLFLLIIPGVFLYVKFIFVTQEVILGGATNFEAGLRDSWEHTSGYWWNLFTILLALEVPLLLLSLLLGRLPVGWGQTFQVIFSTLAQTWIIIVFTHTYVRIRNDE